MDSKKITLITGGIRSGKSRYALSSVQKMNGQKIFIATAEPLDESMSVRIKNHQQERGDEFTTVEEPVYLARAISAVSQNEVILIDCLTLWVNNLFYYFKKDSGKIREQFDLFLDVLVHHPGRIVIVTNEVGLGVIPENELTRTFIDELGSLNQRVAQLSNEVIMMIAGLPQFIKGVNSHEPMDYSLSKNTTNP
jgi:adenosylcobinamide kinase/adenosylcobinamide-phosphate guanylyltransferase